MDAKNYAQTLKNQQKNTTEKKSLDLLTIQEVCEMFQVTRQTISNWERRGFLKKIKPLRKVYFRRADLECLINNQLGG